MGRWSQRARKVLACLAVMGVGGAAGLLAGGSEDSPQAVAELSPAQVIALRFSGGAADPRDVRPAKATAAAAPVSGGYMLASVETGRQASSLMFNPFPTYPIAAAPAQASPLPAQSPPVAAPPVAAPPVAAAPAAAPSAPIASANPRPAPAAPARQSLPPQLATATDEIPTEALGYAAPAESETVLEPAKRAAAPVHTANVSASNAVLNSAQIASIRQRLKLTTYQDQLWPPVEAALRDIAYQGGRDASGRRGAGSHGATIDPNSAPVQRLKSAAFPLLMSLSEDQKEEVRSMVRLMGLENLAAQF